MKRLFIIYIGVLFFHSSLFSQQILTLDSALSKAERINFFIKSDESNILQQKQLQTSAINIPNPDFIMESPSGTFYAFGILQTLDFPSVYILQSQLAKQNILLAEKNRDITVANVRLNTSTAFVEYQYLQQKRKILQIQDSLYTILATNSQKQFDVGEIDYLASTYAASMAGEVHLKYILAKQQLEGANIQLKTFTGMVESFDVDSLRLPDIGLLLVEDSTAYRNNKQMLYLQQVSGVLKKQVQLEKHKALPGLVFGYLNQGSEATPTALKFRVGITIPLWFWQYSANISAAKKGLEAIIYQTQGNTLKLQSDISILRSQLNAYYEIVIYYQMQGLIQSQELINTATRFFNAGLSDYQQYLRTLNDAYQIQLNYLEQLRNLNHAINMYKYLIGQL